VSWGGVGGVGGGKRRVARKDTCPPHSKTLLGAMQRKKPSKRGGERARLEQFHQKRAVKKWSRGTKGTASDKLLLRTPPGTTARSGTEGGEPMKVQAGKQQSWAHPWGMSGKKDMNHFRAKIRQAERNSLNDPHAIELRRPRGKKWQKLPGGNTSFNDKSTEGGKKP